MDKELRILMLEDVAEEAGLIERALKKESIKFTSLRVDSAEEFIVAIDNFHPDVVLSDHALPQFNSIEALKLCRDKGLLIPFILVTGTVSEEFAVACLKQGVDDYILKDNLSRLPSAIKNALKQRDMESRRLLTELKLRDQNEELIKTNEQLRKSNSELDNFVYSVSHNLRAPLMSVLGLIRIARMEEDRSKKLTHELYDMMERSIGRLDETLKEILDYSRNARTEISVNKIDFREMFNSCLERLKYVPNYDRIEKNIEIVGDVDFHADRYRLAVIFQNLVSNAIKYQDATKGKSFMKAEIIESDKEIQILFSDNGIGIAPDQVPVVFNMFYRATEKGEGAGLGLYIVKESIEKLNGEITIESELGKGTVFKITLPNNKV